MNAAEIAIDFESYVSVARRYPDDLLEWPAFAKAWTDTAIRRLLDRNPGRTVVSDSVFCMARDHERFPDGAKTLDGDPAPFVLVRTIKLDRAITVREDAA